VRRPLALLLLTASLAAAAVSVASLALFALALGVALLTACAGIAVALAARRLTIARTIGEPEVQEDEPIRVRFDVRGVRWLPVRVEAQHRSGTWVGLGQAGAGVEFTVGRRGTYRLAPSQLRVRDVLGVCELPLRAGHAEPLLILPTPDIPADVQSPLPAASDDPEPDGIQAYVPGSPLARIHWPALARGGGLQMRRFAAAPSGLPLVVVDTAGTRDSLALDWAARRAAGYILALARSGGCRVLLPGDARETTVTAPGAEWRSVHRRLAMLQASVLSSAPAPGGYGSTIHIRASAAPAAAMRPRTLPLPRGVVPVTSECPEADI
jgi:uncharacterized protein (DUF58 family)